MRFEWATREFVKPDLAVPWLGEPDDNVQSPVITASKTAEPGVTDKDLADATIMCIPLNLKHCTASQVKHHQQASGRFATSQNPKRTKVQEFSKCDRMIEFGDLQDQNRCFAVIFRDARQSQNMLKNFLDVILLGMPVQIGLPKMTTTRMARLECPVLETNDALVPCTEWPDDLTKLFPEVELKAPDTPGQMVYGIHHGTQIEVSRFRHVKGHNVSCRGRLCDRSRAINSQNVHCGCIFNQCDHFDCVAEMTITLPVPHHVNSTGKLDIDDFRSLRFTELIIDDHTAFQKSTNDCFTSKCIKHKRAVDKLVNHVNDNGGWSWVVWHRKGEIRDASSQEAMVENYDTKLHLVLLIPTNPMIRKHKDKDFESMRLKPELQEKRVNHPSWCIGRTEQSTKCSHDETKSSSSKKKKKGKKRQKHKEDGVDSCQISRSTNQQQGLNSSNQMNDNEEFSSGKESHFDSRSSDIRNCSTDLSSHFDDSFINNSHESDELNSGENHESNVHESDSFTNDDGMHDDDDDKGQKTDDVSKHFDREAIEVDDQSDQHDLVNESTNVRNDDNSSNDADENDSSSSDSSSSDDSSSSSDNENQSDSSSGKEGNKSDSSARKNDEKEDDSSFEAPIHAGVGWRFHRKIKRKTIDSDSGGETPSFGNKSTRLSLDEFMAVKNRPTGIAGVESLVDTNTASATDKKKSGRLQKKKTGALVSPEKPKTNRANL